MSAAHDFPGRPLFSKSTRVVLALVLGLAGGIGGATASTAADDPAPVKLAVAVPFVVPRGSGTLLTADELAQYTSELGVLTRQLDAVVDRPVAIGIDPMIIVSIRALGSAAPPSATTWLARLAAASNETFALAYDDTDLTLATQAGATVIPTPQSFDFALDPADFAPKNDTTPTPTPTPDASGMPVFPTTSGLLDWPYTLSGIAWPQDDSVIGSDLKPLAASGYRTTILSSTNVAREGSAGSSVDVDGHRVLVSDSAVSIALRAAARAVSDEDWTTAMATLNAAIAAAARVQSDGAATVLATFDRDVPFTGGRLAQTLTSLEASGGILNLQLNALVSAAGTAATVVDEPQAADRVGLARAAFDAERREQQFSSVAKDALAVTAPRRLLLLGLLANQWQSDEAGWTAAANAFLTDSNTLVSSVEVVQSSGINLLADRATLPIAVTNELDQPVTVYISVRPDTALLAVESSRVKLVIEPNSQGKGQVPVQAISNGTVGITISLTSASGIAIGAPTRATINVQAGWETPVVIVMAALVVAMFAFGVIRSILRRRRTKQTDD